LNAIAGQVHKGALDPETFAKSFSGARSWVSSRFDQETVWQAYADIFIPNAEPRPGLSQVQRGTTAWSTHFPGPREQ
jgi:hypothetical protein